MNKTELKKFAAIVSKNTQKEALYAVLAAGYEFTVDEARQAGVSDPVRVINHLRTENDIPVYLNEHTLPNGEVVKRYRLGTHRKNS